MLFNRNVIQTSRGKIVAGVTLAAVSAGTAVGSVNAVSTNAAQVLPTYKTVSNIPFDPQLSTGYKNFKYAGAQISLTAGEKQAIESYTVLQQKETWWTPQAAAEKVIYRTVASRRSRGPTAHTTKLHFIQHQHS